MTGNLSYHRSASRRSQYFYSVSRRSRDSIVSRLPTYPCVYQDIEASPANGAYDGRTGQTHRSDGHLPGTVYLRKGVAVDQESTRQPHRLLHGTVTTVGTLPRARCRDHGTPRTFSRCTD